MKKLLLTLTLFFLFSGKVYANTKVNAELAKCVDGDTAYFTVNKEEIKTRFLAINTPESTTKKEPFGKEASEYTCNKLTNAKKIVLEYDDNSDKTDKYNRDLVWVWVDDELLQEDLLSVGLAEIKYVYGKYKYVDHLKEVEKVAKKNKLNIWSDYKEEDNTLYIVVGTFILIIMAFTPKGRKKLKKEIKKELDI